MEAAAAGRSTSPMARWWRTATMVYMGWCLALSEVPTQPGVFGVGPEAISCLRCRLETRSRHSGSVHRSDTFHDQCGLVHNMQQAVNQARRVESKLVRLRGELLQRDRSWEKYVMDAKQAIAKEKARHESLKAKITQEIQDLELQQDHCLRAGHRSGPGKSREWISGLPGLLTFATRCLRPWIWTWAWIPAQIRMGFLQTSTWPRSFSVLLALFRARKGRGVPRLLLHPGAPVVYRL